MSRSESKKGVEKSKSKHPRTGNNQNTQPSIMNNPDAYIQIPLSVMSGSVSTPNENISNSNESPCSSVESENYNYILIEGFPSRKEIRKRKSYVMSYNNNTKNADWVYEILNESTLEEKWKEHMWFGKNELEEKTVYQRGHLAAAANHRWCQEAYHDTYLMSNLIPQLSVLNQGMWKTLERHCRELAKTTGCNVHVYTGPLYLKKKGKGVYVPKTNPNNGEMKAVPTHLFKVIIVENKGTVENLECYMMPNEQPEYDNKYTHANKNENEKEKDYSENSSNSDLLCFYEETIENIQKYSNTELKFKINVPQHDMTAHSEQITWKGENKNGESCEAKLNKILILK